MTMPFSMRTLVALLAAAAALAASSTAGAKTSAALQPTKGCDVKVINDWADDGVINGTYANQCYTQAIQRLNLYPDLQGYSDAPDDIRAAQLAARRHDSGPGGPTGGSSAPADPTKGGSPPTDSSKNGGPIQQAFDKGRPGDATSIPLPLLVLGGLAILLLLAALGTWLAKRFQTRRVTPAPAQGPRD
jgi:hypothetical protein